MKKLTSIILSTLGTVLSFTHAHSASFDCNKADTWAEKAVCGNPELSKLDDDMAKKYKENLSSTSGKDYKNNLIIDQRAWLKFQRNTCKEIECLEREYKEYMEDKAQYGVAWNFADELSYSDLPSKNSFSNFSKTFKISIYNSDTGRDDVQEVKNTLSIHSVTNKPYLSVVEGVFFFNNYHICEIGESLATWSQNHWVISDDYEDEAAELRLYPTIHNDKTQLLLRDVDNRLRGMYCGVRGYFDGIVLEREMD